VGRTWSLLLLNFVIHKLRHGLQRVKDPYLRTELEMNGAINRLIMTRGFVGLCV